MEIVNLARIGYVEVPKMLFDAILISRTVNNLYFIMVIILGSLIFAACIYSRIYRNNKNLLNLYLYSILIWGSIEFICIVVGFRTYSANPLYVWIVISFFEDPAWVVGAYAAATWLYKKKFTRT